MRTIHCPKDLGFKNTFSDEDCKSEQYYNNCYHCWSTALAKDKDFINEELIRWFAIAELKKVKEELNLQGSGRCYGKIFNDEYNKILDKHIAKLKGDKE